MGWSRKDYSSQQVRLKVLLNSTRTFGNQSRTRRVSELSRLRVRPATGFSTNVRQAVPIHVASPSKGAVCRRGLENLMVATLHAKMRFKKVLYFPEAEPIDIPGLTYSRGRSQD